MSLVWVRRNGLGSETVHVHGAIQAKNTFLCSRIVFLPLRCFLSCQRDLQALVSKTGKMPEEGLIQKNACVCLCWWSSTWRDTCPAGGPPLSWWYGRGSPSAKGALGTSFPGHLLPFRLILRTDLPIPRPPTCLSGTVGTQGSLNACCVPRTCHALWLSPHPLCTEVCLPHFS